MAQPINFDEANGALGAPVGMTEEQCGTLPVFKIPGLLTLSVWKLSEEERKLVAETGEIALSVLAGGYTQPPVSVEAYVPGTATAISEAYQNQQD